MFMKYPIVIPSYARAGWLMRKRHVTLDQVGHLHPDVLIRDDDPEHDAYAEYLARYPLATTSTCNGKIICRSDLTYDFIVKRAIEQGHERLLVLDDDLYFETYNPVPEARPLYVHTTPDQTRILFDHLMALVCPQLPIASFAPIMSRTHDHVIAFCKPMVMVYAYYLPHFASHTEHLRWSGPELVARRDLAMTLKLLTDGYLTAWMTTCLVPDNVNNPGGCSTYRTIERERIAVRQLKDDYPDFVRTRSKLGWVGDPGLVRQAPVIAWRKAFNRAKFIEHFNEDPSIFARKMIVAYSNTYTKFMEVQHHATN